jgi:hypothetical protein
LARPRSFTSELLIARLSSGGVSDVRWFGCEVLGLPEVEKPERLREGDGVWLSIGAQQLQVGVEEHFSPARKADPAHSVTAGELDAVAARPRVV